MTYTLATVDMSTSRRILRSSVAQAAFPIAAVRFPFFRVSGAPQSLSSWNLQKDKRLETIHCAAKHVTGAWAEREREVVGAGLP